MANKTVDSDAAFKTYVEGLPAYASGTVYMNDDSKYWTFNKQASDKINSMCVNGDDIEVWVYDGTDWITNKIPEVVDNLTTNSAVAALSAKQGKLLNEEMQRGWVNITSLFNVYQSVSVFKAMSDGKTVFVNGRIKTGTADQTMLFSIPQGYRPSSNYITGSTFCMNNVDLLKGSCLANVDHEVQFRINGSVEGSSGIIFTIMWPIGF